MLHWVRGVAVRIQAAARGHLVRAALRPLLPFAKLGRAASEVAFLRALFGRLINMCVFDRVTRKGMPMSDLLKRLGVKTKKAASAQKARGLLLTMAAPTRAVSSTEAVRYTWWVEAMGWTQHFFGSGLASIPPTSSCGKCKGVIMNLRDPNLILRMTSHPWRPRMRPR